MNSKYIEVTDMNTQTLNKEQKTTPTTVRISGSEAIIRCLIAEGVDILYGYPGGAIMPVYDELYKFREERRAKT